MPNPSHADAGIVTTLRNAGEMLDSFVAWHLARGFKHLFLFFDDPADPDIARVAGHPSISVIPHDAALRRAWERLPEGYVMIPYADTEVMARQILNAALAMELARARGLAWLLQIDIDELFFSSGETGAEHFQWADAQPVRTVKYFNNEAVPEKTDIKNPFREVDLFKVPPDLKPKANTQSGQALLRATPQLQPSRFHFYSNGKSAVRLHPPGMRPRSVHVFDDPAETPVQPLISLTHRVLHYTCCGFEQFWQKYRILGSFADKWFGQIDIRTNMGSALHLESRDVVAAGDRQKALAFYRARIAIEDRERCETLIREGVLTRFPQPRQMLAASRG
jgi:Glycosyl transferase family 2